VVAARAGGCGDGDDEHDGDGGGDVNEAVNRAPGV